MILFEITGSNEQHPVYQELEVANGTRQYDFLRSIVSACLTLQRAMLSEHVLKALNFQAIACLHTNPGEYRPCKVNVGAFEPPDHWRVGALMEEFINTVNRQWETADPVFLTAYVLWALNFIHPFINGNGRTARAACYFVLCLKSGQWLPGTRTLPELIRRERAAYVVALQAVDASLQKGILDLTPLHALLTTLLQEQITSIPPPINP